MFTIVYVLLTIGLIFFEGLAIGSGKVRNTISGHIWVARALPLVFLLAPFWFWMTGHFWYPPEPDGFIWNDVLYILIGLFVAAINYKYTTDKLKEQTRGR